MKTIGRFIRRASILSTLALLVSFAQMSAQEPGDTTSSRPYLPSWNFMSLSTAGVDTFLLDHPEWDGRGVIIFVFDTGVDPSIPGLLTTSTGEPKVLDVVDVSGSNVVRFVPARTGDGSTFASDRDSISLTGLPGNAERLPGSEVFVGVIEERTFVNSTVRDFDGDGETSSRFGVMLVETPDSWMVAIDTDGDSIMSDETAIADFRADKETVAFVQDSDWRESPISLGASIDPASKEVSFHYDMNGHGTHVAGIAAGHAINGETGFNGVAPGAQVVSVKFSSDQAEDLTVAGTMKSAIDFAATVSDSLKDAGVPVVVNMSFGIGSGYEGKAEIESYLDELIPQHPNLYFVTSAGNAGPGISSVGIPSAAASLISVGALLPSGIARDSYGAPIDRDIIWDFSSRGGEVDKPDVVAPGTAVSTITRFQYDMEASGTSMASPYVAGVVALLLSAVQSEYPGWIPGQALMRRALRESAVPLAGYHPIEQGAGVVNVKRAWELLKRWKRSGFADGVRDYRISTFAPSFPDREGPAAFWRSAYVPDKNWRQEFSIYAVDAPESPTESGTSFFRAFSLQSDADWLEPIQNTVYMDDAEWTDVEVVYNPEKLTDPGLYSGRVVARRVRGDRPTPPDEVEFELLNTIIVPYRFEPSDQFAVELERREIFPGGIDRYYFAVPDGAIGLNCTLEAHGNSSTSISGSVIDRFGHTHSYLSHVSGAERTRATSLIATQEIGDGIIEVVVEADPFGGRGETAEYSLAVEAIMLGVEVSTEQIGDAWHIEALALNTGNNPFEGAFEYTLKGYSRTLRDTMHDNRYRRPVHLDPNDGALWLSVAFSPTDYMKSTDILMRIVDSTGRSQGSEVFGSPEEWVFLPNFDSNEEAQWFFLEIVFGRAVPPEDEEEGSIPFTITEKHVRPTDFQRLNSYRRDGLYPYVPETMRGVLPELEGGIPDGYRGLGELKVEMPVTTDRSITIEFEVGS